MIVLAGCLLLVADLHSCRSTMRLPPKPQPLDLTKVAKMERIRAKNPIIWADVPDMSIVRVGHTYYMSSTTMHMSPGLPS